MYRLVMFVCAVAVWVRGGAGMMPDCSRASYGVIQCCKKDIISTKDIKLEPSRMEEIQKCFHLGKNSNFNSIPSCDVELCLAKVQGILLEDGSINKKKLAKDIEKRFKPNPELVDVLKHSCVFSDLSTYGPPDGCDLKKQKLCFDIQIIKSCDEWKDDVDCSIVQEMAEKCLKAVL